MKTYLILITLFCFFTCQKTDQAYDSSSLSLEQAIKFKEEIYFNYKKELLSKRSEEMTDQIITINNRQIKFDLQFFGKKLNEGWSLFISLHGGGGTTEEKNNIYWNRHKTLYELENGILFTPRSPTNTWNMWHQSHIDTFFNRIIQNMIVFHDVNPNRIYIMGRSAGGDGVYQVAPRMADRFAAAAMSAGHPNEASPLGLRNIAFAIHMGENDYLYDSSVVPAKSGLYGIPNAEEKPYKISSKSLEKNNEDGKIHEFPILTTRFLGKKIPAGGGFYLRTLPMKIIKNAIKNNEENQIPSTFYIHSWELTPEFMPRLEIPTKDKFITYHNLEKALPKMTELLQEFRFTSFIKFFKRF
mgnify:CR=1 FL=1